MNLNFNLEEIELSGYLSARIEDNNLMNRTYNRIISLLQELKSLRKIISNAQIIEEEKFRSTPEVNKNDDMIRVTINLPIRQWNKIKHS